MPFANLDQDSGLSVLNLWLEEHSYIEGFSASQADIAVFEHVNAGVSAAKFPHVARWYSHINAHGGKTAKFSGIKKAISAYGPAVGSAVPLPADGPTAIPLFAPTPLAVAAAKGAAKPTTWESNAEPSWEDVLDEEMAMEDEDDEDDAAPVKKAAAAAEDDDDFDLFGEEDEEEDAEKAALVAQRLAEYNAKKAAKPKAVAKSMVILDCKPWDDETDMKAMEAEVRGITMEGLVWGTGKLVAIGYGIKKLQITCVVEDDKVGVDDLSDQILAFEDYVQSVDVAAFNKL
ncbi:hypothetical protein BC830DRAFT_804587 [Chytriomyces sp. MP71]|nr:hypothetical protein BC830DRAFT_804587 [Chytriomyces sp. MP71]